MVAEFAGDFSLLFFGAGSVAALILLGNYTSFWELSLMWGIGLTIGIYVAGGISGAHIAPIMIGLIVAVIGGTFGNLTGFALNPARDLGPKLFEAIAGWGHLGIPGPGGYMWVPIVGPFIGGFIGSCSTTTSSPVRSGASTGPCSRPSVASRPTWLASP